MKVIFAQLTKIARQNQWDVQRCDQSTRWPCQNCQSAGPSLLFPTLQRREEQDQTKTGLINVLQHEGCKTNIEPDVNTYDLAPAIRKFVMNPTQCSIRPTPLHSHPTQAQLEQFMQRVQQLTAAYETQNAMLQRLKEELERSA